MNQDKIKYIEENKNNISIFKLLLENNIEYTKNNNGIFINLSKLSEKHIDLIYNNFKNNNTKNIDNERDKLIKKYKQSLINKQNETNIKNYKKFENLTEKDLQIIEYSKKI